MVTGVTYGSRGSIKRHVRTDVASMAKRIISGNNFGPRTI